MSTSASTDFSNTRDDIITRALRICTAIGQGETPTTTQLNEAAQALNHIIKRFQGDGMELWKRSTSYFLPAATQRTYTIPVGPTRVLQAWHRNTSTNVDTPMLLITRQEYDLLNNKSSTGTPNQIYYDPPGPNQGLDTTGMFYVYVVPDSTFAASYRIYWTGIDPIEDFDAGTDNPDFPSYYYNALTWGLASQLSYEYGVPLSERAMIDKKADYERTLALQMDYEEGSLYIQPETIYLR